ncbi:unnamed protein product [Rhizopus microsporus]
MKAKTIKEFQTFGFFVYGSDIELHVLTFNKENVYQLYMTCTTTLATTKGSCSRMDITLGLLVSFKI